MEQRILPPEVEDAPKLTAKRRQSLVAAAMVGWLLIVAIVAWSQGG